MGFRFGLHSQKLPGKPDLVFPRFKKWYFSMVVFGFGMIAPLAGFLNQSSTSGSRNWKKNRERDLSNQMALAALGWDHLVFWECELRDPSALRERVKLFLGDENALD